MKVKFLTDFDHRWRPAVTQAFPKGAEHDLPEAVANELIEAGVAVAIQKPAKKET